ncbi:MAG: tetratricopeptide repeat protein [Paludisphaera borealis]|uniref:tetratricopeptide repeat protein n=1 Tax=Paludisphaera borealis TaxID=1387353 RepID=UPI00283E88D9|nr:tetratricopeptide repeat protein [Paludisphaera borealis]MDR3621116.1 tetratricopeptide repeat protein [Paludisphaera borealis]
MSGSSDGEFQYWERIAMTVRAEATSEHGIDATPAVAIRARRRLSNGLFSKLARKLSKRDPETTWTLPDGKEVERCGERRTDVALAWPDEKTGKLDEQSLRRRWPEFRRFQSLASDLFLVEGEGVGERLRSEMESPGSPESLIKPAEPIDLATAAAQVVESARHRGDAGSEVQALTDLALVVLIGGNAGDAVTHLQKALGLCRELGDRERETDVLCNLGFAQLGVGQAQSSRETLESALVLARESGDVFAEKLVLERLGMAHSNLQDPAGALRHLNRALEMARAAGDRQQEPRLLWRQAIALAEMNRPDQAIAKGKASVAFLRADGKPEASWYEAQIQKYQSDASVLAAPTPDFMGGPIYAGAVTTAQTAPDPKAGPGLLRMALSATKAMATFLGSGMKTAPADVQQARLTTCRTCEHHTGLRCRICGCFTDVKSRMAHEQCPISKWPA